MSKLALLLPYSPEWFRWVKDQMDEHYKPHLAVPYPVEAHVETPATVTPTPEPIVAKPTIPSSLVQTTLLSPPSVKRVRTWEKERPKAVAFTIRALLREMEDRFVAHGLTPVEQRRACLSYRKQSLAKQALKRMRSEDE